MQWGIYDVQKNSKHCLLLVLCSMSKYLLVGQFVRNIVKSCKFDPKVIQFFDLKELKKSSSHQWWRLPKACWCKLSCNSSKFIISATKGFDTVSTMNIYSM